MTTEIPQPIPVDAIPTFTVLTPHYGEKVSCGELLSVPKFTDEVIIRLYSPIRTSFVKKISTPALRFLDTIKQLHPIEWENFGKDT